jgi:hypothetical protein
MGAYGKLSTSMLAGAILAGGRVGLRLPYSIDFTTQADGAMPLPWAGSTWAVSSGVAVNTPTLGAELFANADLETLGAGGVEVFTNWTSTQGDGAIADEGALVHGGSHAAKFTAGATKNTHLSQTDNAPVAGDWARVSFWTQGDGTYQGRYQITNGVAAVNYGDASRIGTGVTGAAYAEIVDVARVTSAGLRLYAHCPATTGGIAYFDDFSVKLLSSPSEVFSLLPKSYSDINASLTPVRGGLWTPVGHVINANHPTNPTSYVLAYLSNTYVYLTKCVNGTFTNLIKTAITYANTKAIRVDSNGTTYRLFYDEVQIGADQTIADAEIVGNKYHGLFSTYEGNQIKDYTLAQYAV